ncbi:hypothetical protein [Nannocystis punicea]|uniref:Uncharacterized protein n=1 Tax=Nannocystis punicea TaxID=2995304 RepID=A0ABY7HF48_9BACT|nr:hypothetical protein [Nannocystis poenicansa]WAS97831.1 hypothetical protein O0S08_16950 [Nannocystis poenicansa]
MSRIRIGDQTWDLSNATLELYHCRGPEADWNLALTHAGETLWLAGTVMPGPASIEALIGAEFTVDLRSLDELAGALLGRSVTLYPGGQGVCALAFRGAASPRGVRLAAAANCDWDRYLETFDRDQPVALDFDLDAAVAALHPGNLP